MSHEIRTPVNSILGFADLLTSPSITTADKERYLRYVSSSSHNLLFLLDEVLEHSRLESGEVRISLGPCNIRDLCIEICESFEKIREQSGKHSISIRTKLPPADENKTIMTDPQRLRQVISNLVNNSLKYTNSGTITFGYLIKGDEIELFVRDTGIGIPPEDLDEIFNRFKRAENQPELTAPGTGLGLSISRSIVSKLGGRIWVESEIGKGSVFKFTIPFNAATESDLSEKEMILDDSGLEPDWHDRTIMIAEDEELNFLFLKEALKPTSIVIHWAKNGNEAIDLVKKHPEIELTLMDVKMPDMDGYEATRQIKTVRPDLPIIIQTAFALSDEKAKSVKQGGDGFITKPINRQLLIRTISRFLR
jgi:two-component system CheB/CheR fusion protein